MPNRQFPAEATIVATIIPGTAITDAALSDAADEVQPTFTVIRTRQLDGYEPEALGPTDDEALPGPLLQARRGDDFAGTSRKAAKTSIAEADVEEFGDVEQLIDSLESAEHMIGLNISSGATSSRVDEERRNVSVDAFIYAASREDDNDFHVIIGLNSEEDTELYLNVEISGLPPASHRNHVELKAVRDVFKNVLSRHPAGLPGSRYDFYKPPLPVRVTGSLFWDVSHETGAKPGPQDLRDHIPTVWEIHPISKLEFRRR
jgi:hypothetical protein